MSAYSDHCKYNPYSGNYCDSFELEKHVSQATIKRRTRLERALNDGQVELAEDIIIPLLIQAGSRNLG